MNVPEKKQTKARAAGQRGTRLSPKERHRDFIEKAIVFFADEGFEGGTRALAKRLGVTQPLLYRYFPSKDDLLREVYHTVYVSRWKDSWTDQIRDRSVPLKERLAAFYVSYTETIFTREWMRIFFFAGLKGLDINKWYVEMVRNRLLLPICGEVRREAGLDPDGDIAEEELDLAWTMHGGIFYHGVRRHIYQMDCEKKLGATINYALDMYLAGARKMLAGQK